MNYKALFSLIFSLSFLTVQAQNIKLTGKVVNDKNESLSDVSINAVSGAGTKSDVDGNFTLILTAGKHVLTFSTIGYAAKQIEVDITAGHLNELNIVLQTASKDLNNVVVSARSTARRETVNSLIAYQKNTNTVASVISAEAIRRSPDRNTGEVLKRVPGTSIQEGKYLVVRGLADRYNQAMLNGILLSSTEPDRKTFSFDLFPAPMIDNIIVNKAFVPELPGEWAGGLVQVQTKEIPSADFLNIEITIPLNLN